MPHHGFEQTSRMGALRPAGTTAYAQAATDFLVAQTRQSTQTENLLIAIGKTPNHVHKHIKGNEWFVGCFICNGVLHSLKRQGLFNLVMLDVVECHVTHDTRQPSFNLTVIMQRI